MPLPWTSDTLPLGEVKLYYHCTGSGPSVVLAHGITDNGLCWTRLANELADDYDLIMLDARGHGQSSQPDTGYLPRDHAADIAALVEALGLEKPALLGHSMGAVNVAVAAATYPELASCVLLEDPPWYLQPSPMTAEGLVSWQAEIRARNTAPLEAIIARGRADHPGWDEIEWQAWASSKQQVTPKVLEWLDEGRSVESWREVARKLKVPTLLITGDPDRGALVTPETAAEAERLAPQLETVHIPATGHNIRRENFAAYLNDVRSFLENTLG